MALSAIFQSQSVHVCVYRNHHYSVLYCRFKKATQSFLFCLLPRLCMVPSCWSHFFKSHIYRYFWTQMLKGRRAVKCYSSTPINSFIHYTTDCVSVAVTLLQLLLKSCMKANIPNDGMSHAIDTSSLCPQLCCAQPLCSQSARSVSVPTHPKLSIQISPTPGPYAWCNDLPERLFSTSHHKVLMHFLLNFFLELSND